MRTRWCTCCFFFKVMVPCEANCMADAAAMLAIKSLCSQEWAIGLRTYSLLSGMTSAILALPSFLFFWAFGVCCGSVQAVLSFFPWLFLIPLCSFVLVLVCLPLWLLNFIYWPKKKKKQLAGFRYVALCTTVPSWKAKRNEYFFVILDSYFHWIMIRLL